MSKTTKIYEAREAVSNLERAVKGTDSLLQKDLYTELHRLLIKARGRLAELTGHTHLKGDTK